MDKTFDKPFVPQFILIILAILVYGQVYFFGYNLDDEIILQSTQFAKSWAGFLELLKSPYFSDANGYSYGYRPVTTLSFYLEYYFFGSSTPIAHLINWLLYLGNVLLIFRLGKFLFRNSVWAFGLAAFFLLHPLHAEVVASIKNRDELLALLFGLLAFFALQKDTWKSLILTIFLIVLSLLSKKSGIGLIIMAPLAGQWLFNMSVNKYRVLAFALALLLFYFFPSESSSIRINAFFLIAGFYFLSERFKRNYQTSWSPAFLSEIILILAFNSSIYCILQFNLPIMILTVLAVVLAYWMSPSYWSGAVLVISAGILSVYAQTWIILILLGLLIRFRPTQNVNFNNIILLVFAALLSYHIAVLTSWMEKILSVIYILPFLFNKLDNRWFMRINFFNLSVALLINLYAFTKWSYIFLLLSLGVIYILKFRKSLNPILIAWILVFGLLLIMVDPTQYLNQSLMLDTSTLDGGATITNTGRELNFIENPLEGQTSLLNRIIAGGNTLGFYIGKFFVPTNLSAYYGYNAVKLLNGSIGFLWIALFGLAVLALGYFRFQNVLISLIAFIIALLPFSNLMVPVAGIVGDRLFFIPSLVLAIALIYFLIATSKKHRYVILVMLAWLVPQAVLSYNRTASWKDKLTLFTNDVQNQPRSVKLNELLADWYYYESAFDENLKHNEAFRHYQSGAIIYPEYDRNWYMMGRIRHEQGNFALALGFYLKVKSLDYVPGDLYLNIANCATQTGDFATADDYYKKAIGIPETSLAAYQQLISLYLKAQNPRLALSTSEVAINNFPEEGSLYENHARIHFQLGDTLKTIDFLKIAINLGTNDPRNVQLLEKLLE